MMDYEGRRLTAVSMNGLETGRDADGRFSVYANVNLTFSNWKDEDRGPEILINLLVPCDDPDPRISDAERLVLDAIAGFLSRAARETGHSLHRCLNETRTETAASGFLSPKD
ncbi:hypothetical protein [Mesorhizobium sp. J428]|uniref:hypothetical protein n=1 Tax=Mesorhizobium sp. J428 TaxID=2898440 RepID=UPI00215080D3|nr:hypothetical protein [Mesorhizobium sp. J428]MCR5859734.1 hypothetical protein [Mesorhizobium sp. J428]